MRNVLGAIAVFICVPFLFGQTTNNAQQPEPLMVQIRKSVFFMKLTCKEGDKTYDGGATGFLVDYPGSRAGIDFPYLVTNRHVALCFNESGQAMQVTSIAVRMNGLSAINGSFLQVMPLNTSGNAAWIFPDDPSIDLAVLPLGPSPDQTDFKTIPVSLFATKDVLQSRRITEGEPIFFTGFFQQFPGITRIEPIVRQGIIAMMPDDKFLLVGRPMHLYFADVHVFGGNSGSPAFINLSGMHENNLSPGQDYRLVGIVNGYIFEDEDFNLQLAATLIQGKGRANSGISTIVPVDDLKALLNGARLQGMRDSVVAGIKAQNESRKHAP